MGPSALPYFSQGRGKKHPADQSPFHTAVLGWLLSWPASPALAPRHASSPSMKTECAVMQMFSVLSLACAPTTLQNPCLPWESSWARPLASEVEEVCSGVGTGENNSGFIHPRRKSWVSWLSPQAWPPVSKLLCMARRDWEYFRVSSYRLLLGSWLCVQLSSLTQRTAHHNPYLLSESSIDSEITNIQTDGLDTKNKRDIQTTERGRKQLFIYMTCSRVGL